MRSTIGLAFTRQRLDTPDSDFLDLDFAHVAGVELDEKSPLVLLLHGLEGDARRGYACELYRQLAQRGLRGVGLNYRTCSGEMNRTWRMYNAGTTADVDLVVRWLEAQYPAVPKALVGISLGGNLLLKYLGEQGNHLPATWRGGVAVSPPLNMRVGVQALLTFPGAMYGRRLLRSLHDKVAQKRALLAERIDVARALQTRTLYEFDEVATAPLYGYDSADDYYDQCSAGRYLAGICRPTLLLRALDDPMIAATDIPHEQLAQQPHLYPVITPHGGHVGFLEGNVWGGYNFWAERQATRFLQNLFANG